MKKGERVFLAEGARLIGDVTIGDDSAVWFNAVLRGDYSKIAIGRGTNIQDNVSVHGTEAYPVTIGDNVSVGHNSVVHGCTVGNNVLIGMGAVILNGAVIGDNSLIGAGALVTEGTVVPEGSLLVGVPGKVRRELTEEEIAGVRQNAEGYRLLKDRYLKGDF